MKAIEPDDLTQEFVDNNFRPLALDEWHKIVENSEHTEEWLVKLSAEGIQFMAEYQQIKESIEGLGFNAPELFEDGTTVTFID